MSTPASSPAVFTVTTCGPGPRPLDRALISLREVDENRNVYCESYDACLDRVVFHRWKGWTCAACPRLAERPPPSEEWAAQDDYAEPIIDKE